MSTSLIPQLKEYKVSSVLNDDRKVYGKKFLFDGKDETCWNSDQGLPQWIHFKFSSEKTIQVLRVQFQGGFAGKECALISYNTTPDGSVSEQAKYEFIPDDSNKVQEFVLPEPMTCIDFQLKFLSTTDFYGRIIIYTLDILGN